MHITFTSQVVSKTWLECGANRFAVECLDLSIVSEENEIEASGRLEGVRCHISVLNYEAGLSILSLYDHDIEELIKHEAYSHQEGGVRIDLPNGPLGSLYVSLMAGKENYGVWDDCLNQALKHPHLLLSFSISLNFSRFEENQYVMRPVTTGQFVSGKPKFEVGMPMPSLVMRRVP